MQAMETPQTIVSFDRFAGAGSTIVLAVSGGGDSMALLDLYRLACLLNPNLPVPHVVTVDHGLRDGFASEAKIVEAFCIKHALAWRKMRWAGDKPKTGIMAKARLARYRLLADAALDAGANIILTGHTLDDQNETLAMRGARGAALPMEDMVLFERRVWIARPLLDVSRADLRAHLAKNQVEFANDPTNTDMRYERSRVRKDTQSARDAKRQDSMSSIEREALNANAANFILLHVKREPEHVLVLRPHTRDQRAERQALRYLAATLGGFDYAAPQSTGDEIGSLFADGQNGVAFTAQRCRFARNEAGILISRDQRHADRPLMPFDTTPFQTFCPLSLLPLANALAQVLHLPPFILPERGSI